MGGAITVGIRLQDGHEEIWDRWTNPLPDWFSRPQFWTGQKEARQYLAAGHPNMTLLSRIEPISYGIVLIDYVTKRVISRQEYCSVWGVKGTMVGCRGARDLLDMKRRGWLTDYEVSRDDGKDSNGFESAEEEAAYWEYVQKIADRGTPGERSWQCHGFGRTWVYCNFKVPGWELDAKGDSHDFWPEVQKWVRDNGWKTPCAKKSQIRHFTFADQRGQFV